MQHVGRGVRIQNTQNRDAKAIHLKLDELLRSIEGARTHLVNLEDFSDEELEHLQREFSRLRRREARQAEECEANGKERGAAAS